MKTNDLLANVEVASPCQASWNQMTGDDRARFCSRCQKTVYNFGAMTSEEITALIRQKEGKVCARFYRRRDGTMLTADCPVGLRRLTRPFHSLKLATAGLLLVALTGSVITAIRNDSATARKPGRFSQLCDEAVWTVKGWFGLQRPMLLGEICVPQPPPTPTKRTGTE